MKHMMIASLISALSLAAVLPAAAASHAEPAEPMTREQAGLFGQQLYSVGRYERGINYLRAAVYGSVSPPSAIPGLVLSDPVRPPQQQTAFARSLAEAYWEYGDTTSAVIVSDQFLSDKRHTLWRCRQAEQVRRFGYALDCYNAIGDSKRAERVIREQSFVASDEAS